MRLVVDCEDDDVIIKTSSAVTMICQKRVSTSSDSHPYGRDIIPVGTLNAWQRRVEGRFSSQFFFAELPLPRVSSARRAPAKNRIQCANPDVSIVIV